MKKQSLIDLQIEESLSRETLMNIDSSNTCEDFVTMGVFSALLLFIVVIAFFSPPKDEVSESNYYFKNNQTNSIFALRNISKWNHYVFVSSSFLVQRFAKSTILENVTFIISINKTINRKTSYLMKPEIYQEDLLVPVKSTKTEPIRLLFDHYPDYDEIIVSIKLKRDMNLPILGTSITWEYGNDSQPVFQIYCRALFCVICFIAFFMLCRRLCEIQFNNWHLEQKLTVILVLFCILADDPLYVVQVLSPSPYFAFFTLFMECLFFSYFRFFIISLFSSLCYKNRSLPNCFFFPKVIFMILDCLIDLAYSVLTSNEIPDEYFPFDISENVEYILYLSKTIVLVIFVIWSIYSIMSASLYIDVTEKYKFRVYIICSIIALIQLVAVHIIDKLDLFKNTSFIFMTTFAVQNFYVILMAVFHWPFEMITDQEYHTTEINENDIDFSFFTNEVDDEQIKNQENLKIQEEEEEEEEKEKV